MWTIPYSIEKLTNTAYMYKIRRCLLNKAGWQRVTQHFIPSPNETEYPNCFISSPLHTALSGHISSKFAPRHTKFNVNYNTDRTRLWIFIGSFLFVTSGSSDIKYLALKPSSNVTGELPAECEWPIYKADDLALFRKRCFSVVVRASWGITFWQKCLNPHFLFWYLLLITTLIFCIPNL